MTYSYKLLEPDWQEINARANYGLWAAAHNMTVPVQPPMNPDQFSPDWRALWSNWLWFISLMLSMIVALVAILAKQWINQYRWRVRADVASNRAWAWRHRAFHRGLEDFHFNTIISTLPLMIHLSLFAFFAGLAIYLLPLHRPLAVTIATGVIIVVFTYIILCVIVPIVRGNCPMSTPIVDHMQHFGHRVIRTLAWLWHCIVSAWSRRSLSLSDLPELSKSRDLETFLEDRLLGGSHGPKLSADALSWMLQHFRNHDYITVALEAVGALNIYRHHGTFADDNLDRIRKTVVWRDQVLATRPAAEVSVIERAHIMRAAVSVQILSREFCDPKLSQLKVIDLSASDRDYGAQLIRAALIGTPRALMDSLFSCTIEDSSQNVIRCIDKAGLALWSAQVTERLIPGETLSPPGIDLSLGHLAVLAWSIVTASLPDEHGHQLRASPASSLENAVVSLEAPYHGVLARRITARAAALVQYQYNDIFRDSEYGTWILEALPVWFEAVRKAPDTGALTELRLLYDTLLSQLAVSTTLVTYGEPHGLLHAVSNFTTQDFSSSLWSNDALLGALELLLRLHQHAEARGRLTPAILTATCSLFEHIAVLPRTIPHVLTSRMIDIIRLLDRRQSRRVLVRWRGGCPGEYAEPLAHVQLPPGRLSLLHRPEAPVDQSSGSEALPKAYFQSVWTSACTLLSAEDDEFLRSLAISMAEDLQATAEYGAATIWLDELFRQNRAAAFLLPPAGQNLATTVAKISTTAWNHAARRLRTIVQENDIRRYGVENFIREVYMTVQGRSDAEIGLPVTPIDPTRDHWIGVRAAIRMGIFRQNGSRETDDSVA